MNKFLYLTCLLIVGSACQETKTMSCRVPDQVGMAAEPVPASSPVVVGSSGVVEKILQRLPSKQAVLSKIGAFFRGSWGVAKIFGKGKGTEIRHFIAQAPDVASGIVPGFVSLVTNNHTLSIVLGLILQPFLHRKLPYLIPTMKSCLALTGSYFLFQIIRDEYQRLRESYRVESSLCTICLEHKCDTLLRPCGHVCVCAECWNQVADQRCPLCRTAVTEQVRAYLS